MASSIRAVLDIWWITFVLFVPIALVSFVLSLLTPRSRKARARLRPAREMAQLDRMSGEEFEQFLRVLFERKGFKVALTPASGDYGVDLILTRPGTGERIAVQAKRYDRRNSVGVRAVQEVYSGKDYYDCARAIVVTTSYFTENAKESARKLGVYLIDRDHLTEEFRQGRAG
ncbi:restriction system protein [Symbiobacterium terraclitae]|uniref:Restriction system protein n=1 Tax=Symbiobacterium terraclitae TaxID=557451 RepID=A0ABS4JQK6_9FIRM|nr:restriction endonuclease [Symbiobacterium terraclitae]MBP2017822.1 restriction system protein [Symbiobacterium terraclitae]